MSADLFAAFEGSSEPPKQPQIQSSFQTADNDPFSFLTSPPAAPQVTDIQQTSQWPSLQQPWSPLQQQQQKQQTTIQPSWNSWTEPHPGNLVTPSASLVTQPQTSGIWGDLGGLAGTQNTSLTAEPNLLDGQDDDDDFGDFEAPTDFPQPFPAVASRQVASPPARTRVHRASTIDLLTNNLVDLGAPSTLEPWQERPSWERREKAQEPPRMPVQKAVSKVVQNADPNVLFDAEDFELQEAADEDEDDFGDFETEITTQPAVAVAPVKSALDLLGSVSPVQPSRPAQPKKQPPGLLLSSAGLNNNNTLPYPQAPKSPYGSFQNRKPELVKQLKVKTPLTPEFPTDVKNESSPTPVTAWPTIERDGFGSDWDEFKDIPATKPKAAPVKAAAKAKNPAKPAQASSDWDWGAWDTTEEPPKATATVVAKSDDHAPPPTNIPPPSILLSIFPQLLDLASTSLLKPVSSLPASSQQRVLSNGATVLFLRGYLALATVAARIIAGRKQRWHRDKFLMQGMAISAATSSKTRGMKLAGVDKAQAAREDREATEVISVWKQQVGRLRTAVAAANAASGADGSLKVPELSAVLSAHVVQGVPTAPKACVICGLKRDERIAKVDFEVEDSFGEWWVEFWGHRDCKNFWLEHEAKLRSRGR
ncbi:hypothetical protein QBC34DRAFT_389411 [Podospora aff. communis PSN243]|uniref:Serine/threonine-protein kinase ppk6 n=1 Tax=Podospora aff. communis PSN243 TaxID=3040156 RepID=A0AAV9H7J0_9PEZI|nr:hypothetical protein QBC34DRAFT_389411 [Podospora aff. communis PSN243]